MTNLNQLFFQNLLLVGLLVFLVLLFKAFKMLKFKVDSGSEMSSLYVVICEGFRAFNFRTLSIVFQLIFYTIIVALIAYAITDISFSFYYILSFGLGSLMMICVHLFVLHLVPKIIMKFSELSQEFFVDSLRSLIQIGYFISTFLVFPIILSFYIHIFIIDDIKYGVGFALGTVVTSFFLRIGGGIFRSSAQLSKSVVDRVELDIRNHKRNPLAFLDIIGRFIGDITGFSSDLISSFMMTIYAVHFSLMAMVGLSDLVSNESQIYILLQLPLIVICLSFFNLIFTYIYSIVRVKFRHNNIFLESIYLGILLNLVFMYGLFKLGLIDSITFNKFGSAEFHPFLAYLMGVIASIVVAYLAYYLTSIYSRPGKSLLRYAETSPSVVLFNALSSGFIGTAVFLFSLIVFLLLAYYFSSILGVALMSLGFLSVMTLLIFSKVCSTFSSCYSDLRSYVETSDSHRGVAKGLVSVCSTTVSIGNSFSTATAILSSVSLLVAFFYKQDIFGQMSPVLLFGLGIGFLAVFFCLLDLWLEVSLMLSKCCEKKCCVNLKKFPI